MRNWWRLNRTAAPNAVRQELEGAFELIARQPLIGSRAMGLNLQGVRRIFLPLIKQHLYYQLLESPDRVLIVSLWHVRRGTGPHI